MTARLEHAITSLYNAFHSNTLQPECACKCAVGNICEQKDFWKHFSDNHGSKKLNYVGLVHERIGRTFYGYTPLQLLTIEYEFLKGCGYSVPLHHSTKNKVDAKDLHTQFKGLCAAIAYLCFLDGEPNVMEITKLFKTSSAQATQIFAL